MIAIAYDFNTDCLKENYHNTSWNNAYKDVRTFLETKKFTWKQGSLMYGDQDMTMVQATLVVQEMSQKFSWLASCLSDIRLLHVDLDDDLMPAVNFASPHADSPATV